MGRRATKPMREFNLEQRVAKELSREKRAAAPRHQTTASLIDEAVRDQPRELKRTLVKKDNLLLDRLKSVYVTSEDVVPQHSATKDNPERPLPSDRSYVGDPDFGYFEPKVVPYGRVTLRDAVEAITRHQEDPILWTPRRLALEYRLSIELTEKMLRHFRMFVMVVPPDSKEKVAAGTQPHTALAGAAPHTVRQLTVGGGMAQDPENKGKS